MPRKKRPPTPFRKIVGERIRAARKAQGLSIYDASQAADLDWSYFAAVERGERSVGLDVLVALAEAVGLAPHQLLDPEFPLPTESGGDQ